MVMWGCHTMTAPVSHGELFDKITILRIKTRRISNEAKLINVSRELRALEAVAEEMDSPTPHGLVRELQQVNEALWDIEDEIREKERRQEFDQQFIQLARRVYRTNDRRAEIKRRVNEVTGSALVEEKSYRNYDDRVAE